MKIKYTSIPLLVLLLIGGGLKLCQTIFAAYSMDFFLSADMTTLCVACCIGLMLVIGIILSLCDRQKPVVNQVSKNIPASMAGFVASVAILGTSALKIISLVTNGSASLFGDVLSVFISLFGGIVLLYENCILFTGINKMKNTQLMALCVPLWFCSRLVSLYSSYAAVAIRRTEIFDFVAVALMAIFFYHQSVYFAELPQKRTPIKLFVFGAPMVIAAVVSTADLITKSVISNAWTDTAIVQYVGDLAIAFYAVFLMYGALRTQKAETAEPQTSQPSTPPAEEVQTALKKDDNTKPIIIRKAVEVETDTAKESEATDASKADDKPVEEKNEVKGADTASEKKTETKPEETPKAKPNVRHAIAVPPKTEPAESTPNDKENKAAVPVFTQKENNTPRSSNDEIDELLKELDD